MQNAYRLFHPGKYKPVLPLRAFQHAILVAATRYKTLWVNAPSQSGKTLVAALYALLKAFSTPDSLTMLLSTNQEQADRILRYIKDNFISNAILSQHRQLKTDRRDYITLAFNNATIMAVPHSIKAVTGNAADAIVNDEGAKWDKDPAAIYLETVARTGHTGGDIMNISSFFGEGRHDPTQPEGFTGSYFAYRFREVFHNPTDYEAALSFTYHVSPNLVASAPGLKAQSRRHMDMFNEHYLGVPRQVQGLAIFHNYFDRTRHTKPLEEIKETCLSRDYPLFLCFDPGLRTGAVLGQLNPEGPKGPTIVGLHAWLSNGDQPLEDFIRSIWQQTYYKYRKHGYHVQVFSDIAANQKNRQTMDTDALIIMRVTGQEPTREYQPVEPGVQVLKSYMSRDGAFVLNQDETMLIETFESGLVHETRAGVTKDAYVKDGFYEHIGDAFRYPCYLMSEGRTADMMATGFNTGITVSTLRGAYD